MQKHNHSHLPPCVAGLPWRVQDVRVHAVPRGAYAALAVLLALLGACALGQAATFPFNGSFELVAGGQPVGWQVEGAWFIRPDAATDGRNGLSVFGDFGKQGARLATVGYLRVKDEPLTLSFTYSSPTGNVSYGLEFCDALGHPLAIGAWESLPTADTTTRYVREIALPEAVEIPAPPPAEPPATPAEGAAPATQPAPAAPAEGTPPAAPPAPAAPAEGTAPAAQPTPAAPAEGAAPAAAPATEATPATETAPAPEPATAPPATVQVHYDSVRLVFRLEADGARIKLDDVRLKRETAFVPLPAPPKIKAELRPNLLPNGGFAMAGECDPRGWTALSDTHHAADLATAIPQSNFLSLQSARGLGAAWLSDPVLLDGALPYRLQANVAAAETPDCRLRLLVAVLDPQDSAAVWLQQAEEVPVGQNGAVMLSLPRLWTKPGAVCARVGFEVLPGASGTAQIRSAALYPEPLSVSVRSAAVAGGFRRPSDVSLFVAAVNNTYAALKPKAMLQTYDADGKLVSGETRAIVIGSRSAAYFPYKPKLPGSGSYRLAVRIVNAGLELGSASYEFRVGEVASLPVPTE